jgi:hypothetical protein
MAIENYFTDITILKNVEGQNQIGGRLKNWAKVATIKGRINKHNANNINTGGRSGEQTEYVGYFKYCADSLTYLKPEARIEFGNIVLKMKGQQKNTLGMNHHIKCELIFYDFLES